MYAERLGPAYFSGNVMQSKSIRFKVFIRSVLLAIPLLAICAPLLHAQTTGDPAASSSSGSFDALAPQQKKMVLDWHAEYEKITGTHVDPETSYDSLNPSVRTTFEAVTNALLKTHLTDAKGQPLGNALSLIKLIESVHGKIPDTRGDQQFRIYVLLADDALDKLYKCREFKRTSDNSVYHIGYPINFRQQGGVPSIQVSVTRTGLRADIDVDYRSSGGPMALVNGHLTSANSDVRAGGNYSRHTKRWSGFGDWWRSLFGTTAQIPKADLAALSSQYTKPKVAASETVDVAAQDFYQSWLVDQRPQLSLSYLSVKANACIAQFGAGETAREGLVRLRTYQHMKNINRRVGKVDSLDAVLRGTVILGDGAQPVTQPNGNIFAVSQIPDDVARALDCRKTQGLRLVEDLPHATRAYGHFYGVSTVLRAKDNKGPGQLLYQIWTREEKSWKIVSWYLENPFELTAVPAPRPADTLITSASDLKKPELANAVDTLLEEWLVARNFAAAEHFFAPESLPCAHLEMDVKNPGTELASNTLLLNWLQQVAGAVPHGSTLETSIQDADYDPNQKVRVSHPHTHSYVLVEVSDDLARMSSCSFRSSGQSVNRNASIGEATYQLNTYQTTFEPKHLSGDRGAVVLTWARRNDKWRVVAFSIENY
jgi:hypothetical protein